MRGVKGKHILTIYLPGDGIRLPLDGIGVPVIKAAWGVDVSLVLELLVAVSVNEISAEAIWC